MDISVHCPSCKTDHLLTNVKIDLIIYDYVDTRGRTKPMYDRLIVQGDCLNGLNGDGVRHTVHYMLPTFIKHGLSIELAERKPLPSCATIAPATVCPTLTSPTTKAPTPRTRPRSHTTPIPPNSSPTL